MPKKYRKKPVVIEAIRWDGSNKVEIQQFMNQYLDENTIKNTLIIPTLECDHIANLGDYIIKGVNGEFYPCKPDIFWKTYEQVNVELEDLVGKHILSGIETGNIGSSGYVGFTLDGVTYRAVEDTCDGYRSYMEDLVVVEQPCKIRLPDIEVVCCMLDDDPHPDDDVLVFIDALNGKTILKIGTENTKDYYPYCVMEYTPENMSCNQTRKEDLQWLN